MPGSFGDILSERLHAERRPALVVRTLPQAGCSSSPSRDAGTGETTELQYQSGIGVDDPVFRNLIRSLQPALENPSLASRLFVDAVTLAIASHVVSSYGVVVRAVVRHRPQRHASLSARQKALALAMVDANLHGELRVADLAREVGLSASHFAYAFKQTVGMAPHGWLAQRRIEKAKTLLRTDDLSLTQIALACGFADQSHFTRQFTARVGCPPGAWRRNATTDDLNR